MEFEFISSGPKGAICKVIQFTSTHIPGVYNIAFGDRDFKTFEISDSVISNNGDSEKVLSTVAHAVMLFLNRYPDKSVFAVGLTASRTRLYQIGLIKNLPEIESRLTLLGLYNNQWIPLKKGLNYEAFLATLKK